MVYKICDYESFQASIRQICADLSLHKISKEKIFDCRLIINELIANVLQHSSGGACLTLEVKDGLVQILVKAEQVYCPPQNKECPETTAERGRGIYLVDSLSQERVFTEEGEILVKVKIV